MFDLHKYDRPKSEKPSGATRRFMNKFSFWGKQVAAQEAELAAITQNDLEEMQADCYEEQIALMTQHLGEPVDVVFGPLDAQPIVAQQKPAGWVWNKALSCCGKKERECECGDLRRYI
jgi:hypothetical protein